MNWEQASDVPSSGESKIMSVVMRRLNAAPRSRGELRTYLLGKEFVSKEIDTVLDRVELMGYIDDAQYALDWVRSRHRSRGLAPSVLTRELVNKDIDIELIEVAVKQISDQDTRERAYQLAAKKYRSVHELEGKVAIRRIASLLQRKGYAPGVCWQIAMETVGAELEAVGDLEG
ncbi:MAG: regulatory protein RecX [Candidatus Nanopelagicales bacterium]|nr:regulatory protein RecX [Candidatus Nanopelagicales bacterium]